MEMSELDGYKILCPIGADSLKYVAGMTGIQKYNGVFIEKKYLPIMHPNITIIKPQLEDDIQRAFNQIPKLLSGEGLGEKVDKDYCFVETEDQFQLYIKINLMTQKKSLSILKLLLCLLTLDQFLELLCQLDRIKVSMYL